MSRDKIVAHFFDPERDMTWRYNLPDPPPPTVDFPYWNGDEFQPVTFHLLYYETEALDKQPHVVYRRLRGEEKLDGEKHKSGRRVSRMQP